MIIQQWHDSASARFSVGLTAEKLFDETWECHCAGSFINNDTINKYAPDRRCQKCGQLVDIKTRKTEGRDGVAISQWPFDKYPPDLIIALWDGKCWKGIIRKNCIVQSGPHPPAHADRGTPYYWIYLDSFRELEFLLQRKSRP